MNYPKLCLRYTKESQHSKKNKKIMVQIIEYRLEGYSHSKIGKHVVISKKRTIDLEKSFLRSLDPKEVIKYHKLIEKAKTIAG